MSNPNAPGVTAPSLTSIPIDPAPIPQTPTQQPAPNLPTTHHGTNTNVYTNDPNVSVATKIQKYLCLQDEIPIRIGRTFYPYPRPYPKSPDDPMRWRWIPQFSFDIRLVISFLSFLFIVIGIGVFSLGQVVVAAILWVLALLLILLRLNVGINQSLRVAKCRAMAKSGEAATLWNLRSKDETSHAKDVFHTVKSFGGNLAVLRDGTTEVLALATVDEKELKDGQEMPGKVAMSVAESGFTPASMAQEV